ncbi:hypothetical protein KAFR_0E03530 [Kazachstania africana CBS 2517]|uniref:Inosine/uridine-preferring nucleoside hydrolase domain-containing protein n=1 Tax=Kazachstania africana (strain ATCC 22294 / BCRC 22015 / CBS 2517 / CECT 1963 / NBRC 1671 / NRRL Y-8276) TaxID=1071382 RepID=H2AVV4_KAZAF|nr:hypothetical protein KAFR_0E03530 [Kazachstania africana CBS 2517]CCF58504.1 hypothetical protein KAFR_0E03530 [Kazachstania africana CBS 2517]
MTITKIPIWLDCDPGHDDAIAILISTFHPAFDLRGISTCYGNSSPKNTNYNARSLLTAMGMSRSIPVYKGAKRPWVRHTHYAEDIHGVTGLDGTSLLPTPSFKCKKDITYLDAVEKEILKFDGELTFVSTGAMTSIATLMKSKPYLKEKIKFISIMGGGIGIGNKNINLSAEFNIWVDPQAAQFVLKDPILKDKCILSPLNLTHKAIANEIIFQRILADGHSKLRRLYFELFEFFYHTYKDIQGFSSGPPVHDPMTLYPILEFYEIESQDIVNFQYKRMDLEVITDLKDPDVGKIYPIVQYDETLQHGLNISGIGTIVGFDINIDYFWDQVLESLELAAKHSTID